jgi:hypothetical protein
MGGLTLDAALRLASAGLPVFPCNGKVPLTDHGFKDATRDETVIRLRWAEAPDANIGVATGAAMNGSKLIVLDVDGSEGEASLAALQSLHGEIPPTVGTRTPRGGRHLWMLAPSDVRIRCSAGKKLGPGLDVRGEGGYVIVPPSSGYSWEGTRSPATMPDRLVGLLREPDRPPRPVVEPRVLEDGDGTPYGLRALEEETERVRSAPEGQRNTQLNESAFRLGQLGAGGELSPGWPRMRCKRPVWPAVFPSMRLTRRSRPGLKPEGLSRELHRRHRLTGLPPWVRRTDRTTGQHPLIPLNHTGLRVRVPQSDTTALALEADILAAFCRDVAAVGLVGEEKRHAPLRRLLPDRAGRADPRRREDRRARRPVHHAACLRAPPRAARSPRRPTATTRSPARMASAWHQRGVRVTDSA